MTETASEPLGKTPLHALHQRLGAKLVPFAGYEMPVQYPAGILKEHAQTREAAGLFDVSHMGQAFLVSTDGSDPASALETMCAADLQSLEAGRQKYSQFLNENGGILDDFMATRPVQALGGDRLYLVVNAACKAADFALIEEKLDGRARLEILEDRALIAVQGPKAAAVAARLLDPALATMPFMGQHLCDFAGETIWISRSGYTGEDGYEISMPVSIAEQLTEAFLNEAEVEPIGLGARDSLRLEAGLCLYGHDIDTETTPIEAGLTWSIGKRRRVEGGFPGAARIQDQLQNGVTRKRVGIRPEGRAPAREGTEVTDADGNPIGTVTSGGFGATVGGPVAMGYVQKDFATAGTALNLNVRGKLLPANVAKLPFVPAGFYRG